ncbi:MAG TPA: thymidylate synthase [Candidatus Paceibacterota bacterium]|nr:thymidylate synthase [Candidatus Paceibacterota bacterium]
MKPYAERTPDPQYQNLLRKIFEEGVEVTPIHGEKARMLVGQQLRYKMDNGFPVITERDLSGPFLKGALAEHIAFLHGARTQAELEAFGCKWWSKWVTKEKCAIFGLPEGDLGDGSYGAAWASFPTKEGEPFNQIKHLVQQIKERPYLRTHFLSPWIPQYTLQHEGLTRKVVVAPCHGWIHVLCFPETKELVIHHFQRSADFPVGVPFNIIQYAAFGLMLGQVIGYSLREVVYTFSDVHIYESQYDKVKELLEREPRRLGTVALDPSVKDIFDFRPDHFMLTDYDPHPKMLIPTPV